MDGFITLIILVIVFNLISAVMRAIKGGGAAAGRQRPEKVMLPDSQLGRFFSMAEFSGPDVPDQSEYNTEFEEEAVSDSTYRLYEPEAMLELTPPQEAGRTILSRPAEPRTKTPEQVNRPAPALGIRKVLTEKESFLAAFVLHEILEPPPTLRRRGKL